MSYKLMTKTFRYTTTFFRKRGPFDLEKGKSSGWLEYTLDKTSYLIILGKDSASQILFKEFLIP